MKAYVGVDLTQHAPLVAKAVFPDVPDDIGKLDSAVLVRHWPPAIELHTGFCPQPPVCLLPIMHGEPPIVGDAAARHRRAAGLAWPPEAQVPYGGDEEAGIGRVPLLAAWTALVPLRGQEDFLTRRADLDFGWRPEGRCISVRAGQMIALSVREFLRGARVDINKSRIAVVVPDALDEAGQQILLDACSEAGMDTDNVHLLPRPLAAALYWCHSAPEFALFRDAPEDDEGHRIGRLRVLTTSMDVWEALSLEVRARLYMGRVWLIPVRDRSSLIGACPELGLLGMSSAVALSGLPPSATLADWWLHLFGSPWLDQRLQRKASLSSDEVRNFQAVIGGHLPDTVLRSLQSLVGQSTAQKFFCHDSYVAHTLGDGLWERQERLLETEGLPLLEVLAVGAFSQFLCDDAVSLFAQTDAGSRPRLCREAAVYGAALAAAATAHGLPCYREKLLPLDLCVRATDDYGDPVLQWKQLTGASSVEAGKTWSSPAPITGLKIEKGQDHLILPLRRSINGHHFFRSVATELTQPAKRGEAVRVKVQVRPGQGFARVHIESATPGVFSARLDWLTMEKCEEPKPAPLAYVPGVLRILPDRQMFEHAESTMRAALHALEKNSPKATECLGQLIRMLNKCPLAYTVERQRGRTADRDFMLHYGVIGSDGQLDDLPEPDLARRLRNLIGERFWELTEAGVPNAPLGKRLLRAGGWFYLAMPSQCYDYLRTRIRQAEQGGTLMSSIELHAIGLAFGEAEDLRRFYPLVVQALHAGLAPNNWLRAMRNICRFRNHSLSPKTVSEPMLAQVVTLVYERLQEQVRIGNFGRILANCLETLPFLLKRRRYEPSFLPPDEEPAKGIIRLLEDLKNKNRWRLPRRLQEVPTATLNFIRRKATVSDLETLLRVGEEDEQND